MVVAALSTTAASGTGSVATDIIWDSRGDLPVGTGADTAVRLAVGPNQYTLVTDPATTTGLKWRKDVTYPAPLSVAIGNALGSITTGDYNFGLGNGAGGQLTTGSGHVAIGIDALRDAATSEGVVAIGASACQQYTGGYSIAIGAYSLAGGSGDENIGIGISTLTNLSTGRENIMIGLNSGTYPVSDYSGVNSTTTARGCIGLGVNTGLIGGVQRSYGVAIGTNATFGGENAIAIGRLASATGAGSVAIGTSAAGTGATTAIADEIKLGTTSHTVNVPGKLNLTGTTSATATAGAGTLPSLPVGFIEVQIAGTNRKIPFYAT